MGNKKNTVKVFPLFLPFLGCSHRCIYCNQFAVTGSFSNNQLSFQKKLLVLEKEINNSNRPFLIGFYGGTFLEVPEYFMEKIFLFLNKVKKNPLFQGIRFSTTPDSILKRKDLLNKLKKYKINLLEIGIQSFDEKVLKKIRRNYNLSQIIESVEFLKREKIPFGIQLMVGLPGETPREMFRKVKWFFEKYKPAFLRLYPLVILKGTELELWWKEGKFVPLSLSEILRRLSVLYNLACYYQIYILKIGLHTEKTLWKELAAPEFFYPNISENLKAYVFLQWLEEKIEELNISEVKIEVSPKIFSWIKANQSRIFTFLKKKFNIEKIIDGEEKKREIIRIAAKERVYQYEWEEVCIESGKKLVREMEGGVNGWKF